MPTTRLLLFLLSLLVMAGCKTAQKNEQTVPETGMIKVAILYPNEEGKNFDMDYYEKSHMPMMAKILGKNLKFYEIDKGIAGRSANDKIPFIAVGYFYCYNHADYNAAIAASREAIMNDIPKYTNIQPIIQISEIKYLR